MYENLVSEIKHNLSLKEDIPSENIEIYKYHLQNLDKSLECPLEFKTAVLSVYNYNLKTKISKIVRTNAVLGLVSLYSKNLEYDKFTIQSLRMLGFYACYLKEEEIELTAISANNYEHTINTLGNKNMSLDEKANIIEEYDGNFKKIEEEIESKGIAFFSQEINKLKHLSDKNLERKFKI